MGAEPQGGGAHGGGIADGLVEKHRGDSGGAQTGIDVGLGQLGRDSGAAVGACGDLDGVGPRVQPVDELAPGVRPLDDHGAVADELARGDGIGGIGALREPARREPVGQLGDRENHARVGLPGGEALRGEGGRDMDGDLLPRDEGRAGIREGARRQGGQVLGILRQSWPYHQLDRALGARGDHPAVVRQCGAVGGVERLGVQALDHVGAAGHRAGDGLVTARTGDAGVVARQQMRGGDGQVEAAPGDRAGMDRVLQQTRLGVRLLDDGGGVAQHSRAQAGDGLDHDQGRRFAAAEHVVSDRQFAHLDAGGPVVLGDTGVYALVTAACEDDLVGPGEILGGPLGEGVSGGGGDDEDPTALRRSARRRGQDGVEGLAPHVGLHHHSGATAQRGVVNGAVAVVGPLAKIVNVQVDESGVSGLADERKVQCPQIVGEDRDDVEAQRAGGRRGWGLTHRRSSSALPTPGKSPPGGSTVMVPASGSISGTSASTKGTATRSPSGVRTMRRSWATPGSRSTTSPSCWGCSSC